MKTSGSTGLHILVPLGGVCTFDQCKSLGQLLARVVVDEQPKIATIARAPSRREGKVYVDYLQNGHGKLLVAPWCVRPIPDAPVSMPLRWSEVKRGLSIRDFTIRNAPERASRMKKEPVLDVLSSRPDLGEVLARLSERLA